MRPVDLQAVRPQMRQGLFHIAGVPECQRVDYQAQRTQLVFLTFAVALSQFPAFAMEGNTGDAIASFAVLC